MIPNLLIIIIFLILIYIVCRIFSKKDFFKIDYSNRISKIWISWSNRPLYSTYKKHNAIEESLNPNMNRFIAGSEDIHTYLDSELLELYNKAPIKVMKADILRLGIIYKRGGWYCDMDVIPFVSWKNIMKNSDVILFSEDDVKISWPCYKENKKMTLRIAYDVFYAKANDDFIKHVINTLKYRCREKDFLSASTDCDIFYYTGPDMFTTAYHTYTNKERLFVYMKNDYKDKLNLGKMGGAQGEKKSGAYRS